MAVRYDPEIIRKFAKQLYARANLLIALCLVIGGGGGYILGVVARDRRGDSPLPVALAVVGVVLGAAIGSNLAFKYKLLAQTALCQVKIEENTRRSRPGSVE